MFCNVMSGMAVPKCRALVSSDCPFLGPVSPETSMRQGCYKGV